MIMNEAALRRAILAVLTVLLSGCISSPMDDADQIAFSGGLVRHTITTPLFTYTVFSRINDEKQALHVYIEGDGKAWLSRTQASPDPTPDNPVGLTLAAVDPAPNVLYLARPCQFTSLTRNPNCQVTYWTDKRFSPEVINSMSQALDQVKAATHISKLALIGYSGGGAVAVLLAEQRDDIQSLRTVAGYLDIAYVNQQHNVSAMPESLNPIDKALQLKRLPQVHFNGEKDRIISPEVARRFVHYTGIRCASEISIPDMNHQGPWARVWPRLLTITPVCHQ